MEQDWLKDFEKTAKEQKKVRDAQRPCIKGIWQIKPPSDSPLRKKSKENTCNLI